MGDVNYDYDEVINYCKGEPCSTVVALTNDLNTLCKAIDDCQAAFHSTYNTGVIGYIYYGFSNIIGSTFQKTGVSGLAVEIANIINVCYSEAMNDKIVLENMNLQGGGVPSSPQVSGDVTQSEDVSGMHMETSPSDFNFKHPESNRIAARARAMGLTDDQIKIAVGISRAESGNYTSNLAVNHFNVGGMRGGDGWAHFDNLDQGIDAYLSNLKTNYFDQGLNTVEAIQGKYAPSSENDGQAWVNLVKGCMS